MRVLVRSIVIAIMAIVGAVAVAVASMLPANVALAATSALIMGGTGRPDPKDFPGYMENVADYYIYPNSFCASAATCTSVSVFTPETAWPLYGGPTAPTWKNSILQGVPLLDAEVMKALDPDGDGVIKPEDKIVVFGYSQSGAIVAIEKRALADNPDIPQSQVQWVIIGDVSRPNGGLNARLPFSIPIVDFPFGPPVPTDTDMTTTDIAFKWDIIADAPLVVTNPLAMLNALLGFEYVHGTYPDPTAASPDSTPGGFSAEEWQAIMDDPEGYALLHPDVVTVEQAEGSDTKYVTVTPKVLPLVAPLHAIPVIGLPIADLIEPALRAIIEITGYDRSIPYGEPTPFRLASAFDPVELSTALLAAIPEGIEKALSDLSNLAPAPSTVSPLSDNSSDNNISTLSARSSKSNDDADIAEGAKADGDESEADGLSTDSKTGDNKTGGNTAVDDDATVDDDNDNDATIDSGNDATVKGHDGATVTGGDATVKDDDAAVKGDDGANGVDGTASNANGADANTTHNNADSHDKDSDNHDAAA
jgi:hypothetical protein